MMERNALEASEREYLKTSLNYCIEMLRMERGEEERKSYRKKIEDSLEKAKKHPDIYQQFLIKYEEMKVK